MVLTAVTLDLPVDVGELVKSQERLLCSRGKVGTKRYRALHGYKGLAMASAVHTMLREVMDIRQAADYLGISADTLYRYASEGLIPSFKLGNRWRFKRSLLDGWMVDQSSGKLSSGVLVVADRRKPVRRAK